MNKDKKFSSIMRLHEQDFVQLKKTIGKNITGEFSKERSYFSLLLDITRSINMTQDLNQLLELIVDSAIVLVKAQRGFLMLFDKNGNLESKVTRHIDKNILAEEELEFSKTIVNQVLAASESVFLSSIYKDKTFKISKSIEILGLRMVMCVPLKVKDRLLGVLYVDSRSETENFTKLEERILEAFAVQASVAIDNSSLYDSSVHDALTALYDYGYLRARLEEEIMRAARSPKINISLLMLDLDNFKMINDSYGHLLGNSILTRVAEVIKKSVRIYDIAARFGGDEFAILMPETNIEDAKGIAQKLQRRIENLDFSVGREIISVTISIGIFALPVEKVTNSENIIIEADHALYVAKSKGVNQIVSFGLREEGRKLERGLIGRSKLISELHHTIKKLARSDATILIVGETGTGKELVANLIHQQSKRLDKSLVIVNCGAVPDNLLESEFFGYEKGAFTGAYRQHKGKFELADGGTIFLDEIGELPIHLQVKILRALEQKEIDRIGGKSSIKVDVRVIAATNKNLEEEVKEGRFRKDLFYRLSVATIYVPPLREHPEDIDVLADYYLKDMNKRYQRRFRDFTKSGMETIMHHSWPGNVRELIHRIERAVIMASGHYISENDLGLTSQGSSTKVLMELRAKTEKESINQVLSRNRWNMTRSAKELGVCRKTLRDLIARYDIKRPDK